MWVSCQIQGSVRGSYAPHADWYICFIKMVVYKTKNRHWSLPLQTKVHAGFMFSQIVSQVVRQVGGQVVCSVALLQIRWIKRPLRSLGSNGRFRGIRRPASATAKSSPMEVGTSGRKRRDKRLLSSAVPLCREYRPQSRCGCLSWDRRSRGSGRGSCPEGWIRPVPRPGPGTDIEA